jgi:hypothetical protein
MDRDLLFWIFALGLFVGFLSGLLVGIHIGNGAVDVDYRIPMAAVGIERFQKCEINTINCQSNWYEIVWKKEK